MTLAARRKAHADDLADFLQHIGTLPRFHASNPTADDVSAEEERAAQAGFNPEGPRLGCYGKQTGFRTDMGVTLKGAGGDGSYEAESVADALIDAGIFDVRSLCRLVLHDELGGLGEMPPLYQMSRLTPGAVLTVMLGIRKFAAINATDNASAAEDESAKVAAVRIPSSHFKYLMESFDANGKPLLDDIPTIAGMTEGDSLDTANNGKADFSQMLKGRGTTTMRQAKGWKALGGDGYSSYEKMVVHNDAELDKLQSPDATHNKLQANERTKQAKQNKMRESAKLKIDAVILWWMEKLRTDYLLLSKKADPEPNAATNAKRQAERVRCKPRIPDAELFPREHRFVIDWLMYDENAYKDARLAFVELDQAYVNPNKTPGATTFWPTKVFKVQNTYCKYEKGAKNEQQLLMNSRFLKELVKKKEVRDLVKMQQPESQQLGAMSATPLQPQDSQISRGGSDGPQRSESELQLAAIL